MSKPTIIKKQTTERKLEQTIQPALRYWMKRNSPQYRVFKDNEIEFELRDDGSAVAICYSIKQT